MARGSPLSRGKAGPWRESAVGSCTRRGVAWGARSCLALTALLASCRTESEQVQYFAATDPNGAGMSFYRVTMEGRAATLDKYTLQAGYFNAVTLDALMGSLEDPPEVKGDQAQMDAVQSIREGLYASLAQWAEPRGTEPTEEDILRAARAYWIASLDDLSLTSVGMTGSLDPFTFQKLAFWAEAETIDLSQMSRQFENLLRNSGAVVSALRGRERARAEERAVERQQAAVTAYFAALRAALGDDSDAIPLVDALERVVLVSTKPLDSKDSRGAMARSLIGALQGRKDALPEPAQALIDRLNEVLLPALPLSTDEGAADPEATETEAEAAETEAGPGEANEDDREEGPPQSGGER